MTMTVGRLHKLLGELVAKGHARKPVTIDKETFSHPLEGDGAVILDVEKAVLQWVPNIDDDGGYKENRDGTESGRMNLVLSGGDWRGVREEPHQSGSKA